VGQQKIASAAQAEAVIFLDLLDIVWPMSSLLSGIPYSYLSYSLSELLATKLRFLCVMTISKILTCLFIGRSLNSNSPTNMAEVLAKKKNN
jgi:hypothetical protein